MNNKENLSVVFADMVGYSMLTARNEEATHSMWMDFVDSCLEPTARKLGAGVVRMLGDGCLLSFESPANALEWCQNVRSTIVEQRNSNAPKWPSLSMRFGAHTCEVIHEKGDIYGDGVNTTKRLQERAQSDGILVSESLYREICEASNSDFRYLGALNYKNLEHAVETYEIVFTDSLPKQRSGETALPAIAILPFKNLTHNRDYDYFAEGLIDDIIQSLAGLKELQVIARGSTLPFAKQSIDPRDVARILSVRYVLQGTIREAGDVVRITFSFEDAEAGDTIFAEKCEIPHTGIFEFQDNIVRDIVARVAPNVRAVELEKALRKPPDNFTAYQCTLRALDLMKSLKKKDFDQAKGFLEQAMKLDPDFVLPVAWAVRWYCVYIGQGWCSDRENTIREARKLADEAIKIDRQNPLALAAYGHVKSYLEKDLTTALVYFDRARQISPSHAIAWVLSSATLSYLGKGDEAVEHAKRGLELSPNDYELFQIYDFLSFAYCCSNDFENALVWGKLSHAENPGYSANLRQLIVASSALKKRDQCNEYVSKLLVVEPAFSVNKYEKICPIADAEIRTTFLDNLRTSGLPQ